ncbi:MAG: amidohydrolase family protein [Bacteroidales bacterium]|nr:amidohydrolase family protein [Bacteroidales bacterium]
MNYDKHSGRRRFLGLSAAGVGSVFLGAEGKYCTNSQRKNNREVFDCHLHCPSSQGEKWQWYKVTHTFDDFARYLEKAGVHKGIINCQRSYNALPEEFIAGNREVADFMNRNKGKFLGACVVNPLFLEEALRELEYCQKELGFVWVGELCNYMIPFDYKAKEFEELMNHVTKLKMIIALHTEGEEMDYISMKFPEATIVFANFGDDHEYQDIFRRIQIVASNPNFYLDTSGYGHDRVGILEYAVKTIGPDRILFGSDFSINDPSTVLARINNALISEDDKQKILSLNLKALLSRFGKSF